LSSLCLLDLSSDTNQWPEYPSFECLTRLTSLQHFDFGEIRHDGLPNVARITQLQSLNFAIDDLSIVDDDGWKQALLPLHDLSRLRAVHTISLQQLSEGALRSLPKTVTELSLIVGTRELAPQSGFPWLSRADCLPALQMLELVVLDGDFEEFKQRARVVRPSLEVRQRIGPRAT